MEVGIANAFRVQMTNRPSMHQNNPTLLLHKQSDDNRLQGHLFQIGISGVFSLELQPARKSETQRAVIGHGTPENLLRNRLGYPKQQSNPVNSSGEAQCASQRMYDQAVPRFILNKKSDLEIMVEQRVPHVLAINEW